VLTVYFTRGSSSSLQRQNNDTLVLTGAMKKMTVQPSLADE